MLRTHTCGELTAKNDGQEVTLCGWVFRRRDHGGLIFVDLRDGYGLTQVCFDPAVNKQAHALGEKVRPEWVIQITGKIRPRKDGATNPNLPTGEIEIFAEKVEVLGESKTPPFELDTDTPIREDLRLEYRYLDLRRPHMQENLKLRHRMAKVIRDYFDEEGFLDIETPVLVKGTPEGSREYLVPSRIHPGEFYVLPQSPQQLKQLLMVSGVDKYFQFARCFRDEDLRGDRQPEFTQFEIEMAFPEQEDIMNVIEGAFVALLENCDTGREWKKYLEDGKFKRLSWQAAMEAYGSDKPDLRFGLEFADMTKEAKTCGFGIFENAECVYVLAVPKNLGEFSRKDIDTFTELARAHGAGGLAWYRVGEDAGPVAKNSKPEFLQALAEKTKSKDGDIIFFGAGAFRTAVEPLGQVRLAVGDHCNLRSADEFAFCWVVDFPWFEKKDDGTLAAEHHPFTLPLTEDLEHLEINPENVRAHAYDVVANGVELGGGSLRVHNQALQYKLFQALGMDDKEIQNKFGHLLKAFSYGCPPHGGCAMGFDRVVMLWAGEENIREVIAFPKNQSAQDLMLGAPSPMPEKEVHEQNISVLEQE